MVVSFIATHQARLRGFLQELINTHDPTRSTTKPSKNLMDFKTDPPEAINNDEIGERQHCRDYNLLNLADWIIQNVLQVEETVSPDEETASQDEATESQDEATASQDEATDIEDIKTKFFDNKDEIASFMNCAILKIHMDGSNVTIELVYQGELEEDKGKRLYFVTQKNTLLTIEQVEFTKITLPLEKTILSHFAGKKKYTFYLMRHGQGDHNVRKGATKRFTQLFYTGNTTLTKKGIDQAIKAAKALDLNPTTINYLFTSDLKRTRETLAYFYMQLCIELINKNIKTNKTNKTNKPIEINKTFYILPCSHELAYEKSNETSTNIDKLNEGVVIASENKPACQFNEIIIQEANYPFTFTSNASYYEKFYDSNCRYGIFRNSWFGRKGGKKKTRKARVSHKTTYKRKGKKSNSHRRRRRRNTKKRIR